SQDEAIRRAKQRGVSDMQIEEFRRSAYQKAVTGQNQITGDLELSTIDTIDFNRILKNPEKTIDDTADLVAKDKEYLNYFGYKIFYEGSDKYSPYEYGPIDPNYQIGPGDEIIVSIWGETERRYKLIVSRDGTIFVENYGQVIVNGLTVEKLEVKLTKYLSKIYSSLNPANGKPTTYLDVSLGKLKSIKVFIVGDVQNPGSYFTSSYSTAFSALQQSGGPTIKGSLRDVQLIRKGEVISHIDLYDFITKGKLVKDESLQNNDIIFVPPRLSTVTLNGEVKNELIYELKTNETINDLILYSGGLKSTVDIQKFQILRTLSFQERQEKNIHFTVLDTVLGRIKGNAVVINTIPIQDNDIVTIFPIVDYDFKIEEIPGGTKTVNISGHVLNPGRFLLQGNMKVSDLINKSGGFDDPYFWGETYQVRADLYRYNDDGLTQKIIPLRLNEIINGNTEEDQLLLNRDSLVIYDASINFFKKVVTIRGEVKNPDNYIFSDQITLQDILLKSGGFTKEAYKYIVEVYRINTKKTNYYKDSLVVVHKVEITPDILNNFDNTNSFYLEDNDMVVVRYHPDFEYQRIVTITGEVKFPGEYPILQKNETLKDLIDRAGGFSNEAFVPGIKYTRVNNKKIVGLGENQIVGDFEKSIGNNKSIKLQDGDYIFVPKFPGTVEVKGLVNNPGFVQYNSQWNLKDYVEAAGDFTFNAHKRKSVIYYPGGNAKRRNIFRDPRVKEGSVISVPQKPEREPVNTTQLITNIAQIAASLATIVLIIQSYSK
ncbi:MAG: SLBB domain-containing protein, partial [Prolixibacteraceae bacterium]|nr:SLBB domain-containing protein [Prolixibacteraceae bacterium]